MPTLDNVSDLFTKPLEREPFLRHRDTIMPQIQQSEHVPLVGGVWLFKTPVQHDRNYQCKHKERTMGPEDTRPAKITYVCDLVYLVCIFVISFVVTAAILLSVINHLRQRHAAEVEHNYATWTAPTMAILNWNAPMLDHGAGYQIFLDSGAAIHIIPEPLTTLYGPFQTLDDLHSNSDTALHSDNVSDNGSQYSDMWPDFQMDEDDYEEPAVLSIIPIRNAP